MFCPVYLYTSLYNRKEEQDENEKRGGSRNDSKGMKYLCSTTKEVISKSNICFYLRK
jgi:hypothetical protein